MSDWLSELQELRAKNEKAVLVTVAGTRGSTPREVGAKMIVTATETIGTIGGGQLEYRCTQEACRWLGDIYTNPQSDRTMLRKFTLGANCGQCCGGVAEILFEELAPARSGWVEQLTKFREAGIAAAMVTARQSRTSTVKLLVTANDWFSYGDNLTPDQAMIDLARRTFRSDEGVDRDVARLASNVELPVLIEAVRERDFRVIIFGAGHVGTACAAMLSMLDAKIDVIDSRKGFITNHLPANVAGHELVDPAHYVAGAPPNSFFLVMTHDHGLDFDICTQILQRSDAAFCGLIGSRSKRRRFEKRFRALGMSEAAIGRLTCPIGVNEISGKKPAEIAVAVAAQLQSLHESGMRAGEPDCASHPTVDRAKQAIGRQK